MNVAFLIISAISVVLMIARAPEAAFPTMIDGVTHAIELSIKLCAIYAVWLSVLKMVEATSLDQKTLQTLRPLVRKIFKNRKRRSVRLYLDKSCGKHVRYGRSRNACRHKSDERNERR